MTFPSTRLFAPGKPALHTARLVATLAHAGQVDKCGDPYIRHPVAVAAMCETEEQKILALLHDVVEDTWVTLTDLMMIFSERIVMALDDITRRPGEPHEEYWTRLRVSEYADLSVYVKDRDISHNSLPERLARLDEPTQDRLRNKAMRARRTIGLPVDLSLGYCECGNKFSDDNLCMESACQMET